MTSKCSSRPMTSVIPLNDFGGSDLLIRSREALCPLLP
jgi:hypothetical protein